MASAKATDVVICPTCTRECGPEEPFCWRCQTPLRGASSSKSVPAGGGIAVRQLLIAAVLLLVGGGLVYKFWWQALPSAETRSAPPPPPTMVVEAPVVKPKVSVIPATPVPKFVEVPGKPLTWEATSADGRTVLAQQASQGGECAFNCTTRSAALWSAKGMCQGSVHDLHFVSANCERSVTFFAKPEGSARNFVAVFDRILLAWKVPAVALVEDSSMAARPQIIQGIGETPGKAPTYSIDGETVDFTTIDDKTQHVPLRP